MTSASIKSPADFGLTAQPVATRRTLRTELKLGVGFVGGTLAALLGWSLLAPLDAAVPASGVVRISGQRQIIQNQDGGTISVLAVKEGQHVRKGQLLVQFADMAAVAQERAFAVRVLGLQADIARLEAEQAGMPEVREPSAFASLAGADRTEADRAMAQARRTFAADQDVERAEAAVVSSQIGQIGSQITGYAQRESANKSQIDLNDRELQQVQGLAAKGYATVSRVLALQRSGVALRGDAGQLRSEMARLHSAGGEARLNMMRAREERAQRRADALRTSQDQLQASLPQWRAARDALDRARLVAPVDGVVMGLSVFASGAVASPGQRLMEIVPQDRGVEIDARVSAQDANDVHVGRQAKIHLSSLHGRNLPALTATVTRISPDSFTDDRSGQSFYTARLRVERGDLSAKLRAAGLDDTVRPGTPVSIEIGVYQRTAFEYWFAPLAQAMEGAFHER